MVAGISDANCAIIIDIDPLGRSQRDRRIDAPALGFAPASDTHTVIARVSDRDPVLRDRDILWISEGDVVPVHNDILCPTVFVQELDPVIPRIRHDDGAMSIGIDTGRPMQLVSVDSVFSPVVLTASIAVDDSDPMGMWFGHEDPSIRKHGDGAGGSHVFYSQIPGGRMTFILRGGAGLAAGQQHDE